MATDLNAIISNSSSVDDLMEALKSESTGAKQASAQLQQLYAAAEGVGNSGGWLQDIKNLISPNSTAGKLQYQKEYNDYVIDMQSNGEKPVSREEFLQKMEEIKAQRGTKQG